MHVHETRLAMNDRIGKSVANRSRFPRNIPRRDTCEFKIAETSRDDDPIIDIFKATLYQLILRHSRKLHFTRVTRSYATGAVDRPIRRPSVLGFGSSTDGGT